MSVEFRTRKQKSLDHTIKRIAQVACGFVYDNDKSLEELKIPYLKHEQTDKWVLNAGNDWFLFLQKEDDDFRYWQLSYRYTTPERQVGLDGLGKFLEYTLGDSLELPKAMTYQEFEAWLEPKWEGELDGLDRIDLMWAAYKKGIYSG